MTRRDGQVAAAQQGDAARFAICGRAGGAAQVASNVVALAFCPTTDRVGARAAVVRAA